MVFPRARLAVSACLFIAWLSFLGYLVAVTRDPIILSRPQLFVSNLHVIATIGASKSEAPDQLATIKDVVWSPDQADKQLIGSVIPVLNLARLTNAQGWRGPGDYIVPLLKRKMGDETTFLITPLPVSPGFTPQFYSLELLSPGDNKSAVSGAITSLLNIDPAAAQKTVDESPRTIAWNIRLAEVLTWKSTFGKLGAVVQEHNEEVRIYQATPAAVAQLSEINSSRHQQ